MPEGLSHIDIFCLVVVAFNKETRFLRVVTRGMTSQLRRYLYFQHMVGCSHFGRLNNNVADDLDCNVCWLVDDDEEEEKRVTICIFMTVMLMKGVQVEEGLKERENGLDNEDEDVSWHEKTKNENK